MKRILMVAVLAGVAMAGCEEKKVDNMVDKTKQATTDATNKVKDGANAAVDATKDMGKTLKADVQNLMDTIKGKVETLTKGGDALKPDQKAEFDKAMTTIKSGWEDLSKKWTEMSAKGGDAMATGMADLKTAGTKLLDSVKTTAEKFGIKLN